jgi:hypothetical protein
MDTPPLKIFRRNTNAMDAAQAGCEISSHLALGKIVRRYFVATLRRQGDRFFKIGNFSFTKL